MQNRQQINKVPKFNKTAEIYKTNKIALFEKTKRLKYNIFKIEQKKNYRRI